MVFSGDCSSSAVQFHSTLLYTYTTAYHGFAASLSLEEAQQLRQSDSVIDIQEESIYTLDTTWTPEFLGLNREVDLWAGYTLQEFNDASQDIIIGGLDSGVWPESSSFKDNDIPDCL
ncbi:Inhibitor I9 domain-containing protein [Heracleum sosnowskyi]|uniref:Inhibitor I9 domain-containing protein n=1 Tax=Heracleum sosnowskyi TaxID=360622 RepID=A0AAD8GTF4_9APIA|nr:Inhibitor I9 domain-containing protein [Heracleum sosnowskyi]